MRDATFCGVSRGTLGELYQGPHWWGRNPEIAIVSIPAEKYSWCYFTADPSLPAACERDLAGRPKTVTAIHRFLQHVGAPVPRGRWQIHSELPVAKGMASSTADIVAALRCLSQIFGRRDDPALVSTVLHGIERSDAVFLDGFALYLSAAHRLVRTLAPAPRLHACYVVEGAAVDTDACTDRLLDDYRRRRAKYASALDALLDAFSRRDAKLVAEAATASAHLSQDVLPKECFDAVLADRAALGAGGVFVAHTGSVVGYLLTRPPCPVQAAELSAFFHGLGRQCAFAQI